MGRPPQIRSAVLEALRDHPFLSRRQLELYLHCSSAGVRYNLRELRKRGWVWQTNAHQPLIRTRAIYALTEAGIQELARQSKVSYRDYVSHYRLSADRLSRLIIMLERGFQLRTLFLWLSGSNSRRGLLELNPGTQRRKTSQTISKKDVNKKTQDGSTTTTSATNPRTWDAITWDVEVGKLFSTKHSAVWIPFHAAAVMWRVAEQPRITPGVSSSVHRDAGNTKDGRWSFVVVEFDVRRVPVERDRERLTQFVAAQDDPRYWGKDKEQSFPVLLIVAQDELRLQEYYNLLRTAALARQLPMPRAYLTTLRTMLSLRQDRSAPIWYSTISGRRTSLLFDTEGLATPVPTQPLWRKMPLIETGGQIRDGKNSGVTLAPHAFRSAGVTPLFLSSKLGIENKQGAKIDLEEKRASLARNTGVIVPELATAGSIVQTSASDTSKTDSQVAIAESNRPATAGDLNPESLNEFAQIALFLKPLAKEILDEIAAHPLLTRQDLALLLKVSVRRIRIAIAELQQLELIELHRDRYVIAQMGQQYLAQVAGFGNAVKRYARARGWGNGFDSLLRHWEHTQAENEFFLNLAEVALERGHRLTWLSELEARLYYEAGQTWHSFLPDGRGTYIAGKKRYEFALEMDRSRSSLERFRGKFVEYDACVNSNVLLSEGVEFLRLLVVTTSWERAEAWRRAALQVQVRLPVFITTAGRLQASGIDAPIWLRGDLANSENAATSPKVYCFECFGERK